VKIFIATHKDFLAPPDKNYIPIHVGAARTIHSINILTDSDGINISEKNGTFCELTALYWIWKNYHGDDVLGLCHYRRFFLFRKWENFITKRLPYSYSEFYSLKNALKANLKLLDNYDIILPEPVSLEGLTVYEHYAVFNRKNDLDCLGEVLRELYPDYFDSFITYLHTSRILSPYNMFLTTRHILDNYCDWLFRVLFELEARLTPSEDPYQSRVFGFLAERMLHFYVLHNNLKVKYFPVVKIEDLAIESLNLDSSLKKALKNLIIRHQL
jgi:hypothetical protein